MHEVRVTINLRKFVNKLSEKHCPHPFFFNVYAGLDIRIEHSPILDK